MEGLKHFPTLQCFRWHTAWCPLLRDPTSTLAHHPVFTSLRGPTSSLAHHPVSTPFETQRPCWHTTQCLALIPFVTTQAYKYCPILTFRAFSQGFKMCLLRRGFHTLINNVLFHSPTDVEFHSLSPSSPTFALTFVPFSNPYGMGRW